MLLELEEFKEANGDCDVPYFYAKNPQLGTWVQSQGQEYKNDRLSSERCRKLKELGYT